MQALIQEGGDTAKAQVVLEGIVEALFLCSDNMTRSGSPLLHAFRASTANLLWGEPRLSYETFVCLHA